MPEIIKGAVDSSVDIYITDELGLPAVGLLWNTPGIALEYRRMGSTPVAITPVAGSLTSHTDGGFVEDGGGVYKLDLPDAVAAAGAANSAKVHGEIPGYVIMPVSIDLIDTPLTAAAVWDNSTRRLSDGQNIVLAKGVGVTGFNDVSQQDVSDAAENAIQEQDLPGLLGTLQDDVTDIEDTLVLVPAAAASAVWGSATRRLSDGTNIVLAKGVGVTGFNDVSTAQVQTSAGAALSAYDPPTHAEMESRFTGVLDNLALVGENVLIVDSKVNSVPANVWAATTRRLSDGQNIVLAKGVGLTGLNDISTADVATGAGTALVTYDPPTKAEQDAMAVTLGNLVLAVAPSILEGEAAEEFFANQPASPLPTEQIDEIVQEVVSGLADGFSAPGGGVLRGEIASASISRDKFLEVIQGEQKIITFIIQAESGEFDQPNPEIVHVKIVDPKGNTVEHEYVAIIEDSDTDSDTASAIELITSESDIQIFRLTLSPTDTRELQAGLTKIEVTIDTQKARITQAMKILEEL